MKKIISLLIIVALSVNSIIIAYSAPVLNIIQNKSSYSVGESVSIELNINFDGSNPTSGYYIESGFLPPGLTISDTSVPAANAPRYITGNPTTQGVYTAVVAINFDGQAGGKKTAQLTITIDKEEQPFKNQLSLSDITKALNDQPFAITPQTVESPSISYTISDNTVASVDTAGLVTIQNMGKTSITVTAAETANYKVTTKTFILTVGKPKPEITNPPTASSAARGQSLMVSALSGGTANVPGKFVWKEPHTVLYSDGAFEALFIPDDTDTYDTASLMVPVKVIMFVYSSKKETPYIITQPEVLDIPEGTVFWKIPVTNGEASVEGTFTWLNLNTVLKKSGDYAVVFMPADSIKYETIETTAYITVKDKNDAAKVSHEPEIVVNTIDISNIDMLKNKYTFNLTPGKNSDGTYKPAVATLPYDILSSLSDKSDKNTSDKEFLFEINTPFAICQLPVDIASCISDFDAILERNALEAGDISFKITMTRHEADGYIDKLTAVPFLSRNLSPPVSLEIEIADNLTGITVGTVKTFKKEITTIIPLQGNLKSISKSWCAGRYDENTSKLEFIPSYKMSIDGRPYIIIRSKTTGVYIAAEKN